MVQPSLKQLIDALASGAFLSWQLIEKECSRMTVLEDVDKFIDGVDDVYARNQTAVDCCSRMAVLIAGNDQNAAIKLFRFDDEINRQSVQMRLRYACFVSKFGDLDGALECGARVYSLSDNIADVYARIADAYFFQSRNFTEVISYVDKDLQCGRSGEWAFYFKARLAILGGDLVKGVDLLKDAYRMSPNVRGLNTSLAKFLMNNWLYPQAIRILEEESRPKDDTNLLLCHCQLVVAKIGYAISSFPGDHLKKLGTQYNDLIAAGLSNTQCCFLGTELNVPSHWDALHLFHEVVLFQPYRFKSENDCPLIIDGGSNCGFSIGYFKHLYPESKLIGIEPNPSVYSILKSNADSNSWENVTLYRAALTGESGDSLSLHSQVGHSMNTSVVGGFVKSSDSALCSTVHTVSLQELVSGPVDFLKLDIEGAEAEVLDSSSASLSLVKCGFIEYHYRQGELGSKNRLEKILEVINNLGMRYTVQQPFERVPSWNEARLLEPGRRWSLNIFFSN
ncbi:FkbM family methyltransferase [Puniceicoccaceae bacterium K14]|nr:FkbM family methyltransferase [Puniceicoccaceae bacterium K14]